MPRDEGGWLKPDALKTAGIGEEWAREIDGVIHTVTLRHDVRQGGYVTQHTLIGSADDTMVREIHAWQVGENLHLARRFFRERVESLGGRV